MPPATPLVRSTVRTKHVPRTSSSPTLILKANDTETDEEHAEKHRYSASYRISHLFFFVTGYQVGSSTVVLATAHPSKFSDVVLKETGIRAELPDNLKNILLKKEKYEKLPKDLKKIQKYILERV